MASNVVLMLKPIEGESVIESDAFSETGLIEMESWNWGFDNAFDFHVGEQGQPGTGNVQDITFTQYASKASPDLMIACLNGTVFKEGIIFNLRTAGEGTMESFLTIKMGTVAIKDVSTGGSGEESRALETYSFNFRTYEVIYVYPDGGEVVKDYLIPHETETYDPEGWAGEMVGEVWSGKYKK